MHPIEEKPPMSATKLTPDQIERVQSSFAKVAPIADAAAALFYTRLFDIAPEVKPLFRSDMHEQGRKLMAMLGMAVGSLRKLDAILPAVEAMAVRHVRYGVSPAFYKPVGEALIWTLEQGLGEDFTPETRDAWLAVYTTLSGVMIAATQESRAAA
jgi:hemoglobin-like flavoprotein